MFVLDDDPPRGAETLAGLELEHGLLPATLTFRTPRGGLHRWYKGRCRNTASKIGPNVDTRGYNGYVLLPPSRTSDGAYTQVDASPAVDSPQWIIDLAHAEAEQNAVADVELDLAVNKERAINRLRALVANGDVAIQGAGGDNRTYEIMCEMRDLGLSVEGAVKLVNDEWNPYCKPEWTIEELAVKGVNAFTYSQNKGPAYAVAPSEITFKEFVAAQPEEPVKRSRYYPYELTDVDAFVPPEWLVPELLPKRGTVQITGPQKSFKTFLTLDLALGLAAGEITFGHKCEALPVVYIAGENAATIALKHVPAWCLSRNQEPALLPFRIVQSMPHAAFPEEMQEFVTEIKRHEIQPGLVVIDTATRALRGLDENSAKDMGMFSAACEMIQRELDCTVLVIRHTGKDAARGGRGSNVIEGDFDTILEVERHEKTMFVKLSVKEQRNASEREQPYMFEGQVCGPSLIMNPITVAEYSRATAKADIIGPRAVGRALIQLKAFDEEHAVTTDTLAVELVPPMVGESAIQRDQSIARASRALRKRAKLNVFSGYAADMGGKLMWFIPSELLEQEPEGEEKTAEIEGDDPGDQV